MDEELIRDLCSLGIILLAIEKYEKGEITIKELNPCEVSKND